MTPPLLIDFDQESFERRLINFIFVELDLKS